MLRKHNFAVDSASFRNDKQPHVTDEAVCNHTRQKFGAKQKHLSGYSLAAEVL
jgi:hypothetical protein